MSHIKFATLTILAAAAIPAQAFANEAYVFGSIGNSDVSHSIERDIGANPPMLPVADTSGTTTAQDSGSSYQIGAGYQFDLGDSPFFVALEGFYGIEDIQTRNINSILITEVDVEARYGARVVSGIDVTDNFSFYTHGGYTWVDFDLTNRYTFAPPVTQRSDTESAFSYGMGVRYGITENISAVVDYTRVQDIDFGGIPEVAGNTNRVNPNRLALETISTGLRFSF